MFPYRSYTDTGFLVELQPIPFDRGHARFLLFTWMRARARGSSGVAKMFAVFHDL